MDILNPRRILILSPSTTQIAPLLKGIRILPTIPKTATNLPEDQQSYTYPIHTPYYTTTVPVWYDTIANPEEWKKEWTSTEEAGDVVRAVGAWIVNFEKPIGRTELESITHLLRSVHEVLIHHTSTASYDTTYNPTDSIFLAVAVNQSITPSLTLSNDEWEDLCRENGGWEYIDISSENPAAEEPGREREGWQRNEYGETSGLARVREALEANDWDAVDDIIPFATDDINFQEPNIGEDDESDGSNLDIEVGELESEMTGMRRAIWENRGEESQDGDGIIDKQDGEGVDDEADDMKVVELQNMMLKMQAVKDMGADMPPSERKRFATKAVRDILRTV